VLVNIFNNLVFFLILILQVLNKIDNPFPVSNKLNSFLTLFIGLRNEYTRRRGNIAGLERYFRGDISSLLEDSIGIRGSFHRMWTVNSITFLLTFSGKYI
jgi:hypothetical protein